MRELKFIVFLVLLGLINFSLFAHKVNIFGYVEQDKIHIESYFPDGKAVCDAKVEVYDSTGNIILEGKTDKEGKFSFKIPKIDNLNIVVDASMGHKSSYTIKKEEIEEEAKSTHTVSSLNTDTSNDLESVIEKIIDKKFTILRREINKMEHKIYLSELIGGVGYILGIMGILFYFLSKKEKKN